MFQASRPRLAVFRWVLLIAVSAILFHLGSEWPRSRRERLLEVADNHARVGANYQQSGNQLIAAWHDQMRAEFERAAERLWVAPPTSRPFPPPGWKPPTR